MHPQHFASSSISENPLMSLMQTQIFEGPFDNANTENIVFPEVRALADQRIYGNQEVLAEVSRFKQLFLNKKECLLHGNLHTGSIMVKDGAAKVFSWRVSLKLSWNEAV